MPDQITDPQDPRLADYVALTDVALRRRIEPEGGLYIAESEKVIRRALAAGHRPRSYLMAQRWLTDLGDVVADAEAHGIPVMGSTRPSRASQAFTCTVAPWRRCTAPPCPRWPTSCVERGGWSCSRTSSTHQCGRDLPLLRRAGRRCRARHPTLC